MSARFPQKEALLQNGKNITVHEALRRRKAYIEWGAAMLPKEIVNVTAISTPVPCTPWYDTFHLGLGRPEPRYPAYVVSTPNMLWEHPHDSASLSSIQSYVFPPSSIYLRLTPASAPRSKTKHH